MFSRFFYVAALLFLSSLAHGDEIPNVNYPGTLFQSASGLSEVQLSTGMDAAIVRRRKKETYRVAIRADWARFFDFYIFDDSDVIIGVLKSRFMGSRKATYDQLPQEALVFIRKDIVFAKFRLEDLVGKGATLPASTSHLKWLEKLIIDEKADEFRFETTSGRGYAFGRKDGTLLQVAFFENSDVKLIAEGELIPGPPKFGGPQEGVIKVKRWGRGSGENEFKVVTRDDTLIPLKGNAGRAAWVVEDEGGVKRCLGPWRPKAEFWKESPAKEKQMRLAPPLLGLLFAGHKPKMVGNELRLEKTGPADESSLLLCFFSHDSKKQAPETVAILISDKRMFLRKLSERKWTEKAFKKNELVFAKNVQGVTEVSGSLKLGAFGIRDLYLMEGESLRVEVKATPLERPPSASVDEFVSRFQAP